MIHHVPSGRRPEISRPMSGTLSERLPPGIFGLREMPDGDHQCHGDFHPRNVLGNASHPMVIDWPNAWLR